MAHRILDLRVLFAFSTTVTAITAVAILIFGAPLKIVVPANYATVAIAAFASDWARRRVGDR